MALLWTYVKRHRGKLALALLLATINQVFSLLDPQIFRMIVDDYASKAGTMPGEVFIRGVLLLLAASIGVAFVSRVAKNFQDYYVNVIVQRVGARLYGDAIEHTFSLPYAVFEDQRSGELLQKLQKARADSQALINQSINTIFLSLVGIVFVIGYAFTVSWMVGVVYFLLIPVLGSITFLITRRIKTIQTTIVKQTAELAGSTTETLRNVELVKSLGLEDQENRHLNDVNEAILQLELKKIKMVRYMSFLQGTLINALRASLLLLMLWLLSTNAITLGSFFSLYIYSFFIFGPLAELGNVANTYQEARASMERVQEVLRTEPEAMPASPTALGPLRDIQFEHAAFQYPSADKTSVRDIDLSITGGETVAFVGPSGSGKSTLIKLLVGLYHTSEGTLRFNGTDVRDVDLHALRRRVGLVTQDTQLFAGTIRENLLFVRPDASDDDCLSALSQAAALPIIERGGKGLDTRIGEGGVKISGGERQRLAIARALLRNPELLIFDEATSALDSLTERAITQTIRDITERRPNTMTVLVAHRLSTIAHAQRIYVLERGRIIESGAHDELLQKAGLYAALWRGQQASQEELA